MGREADGTKVRLSKIDAMTMTNDESRMISDQRIAILVHSSSSSFVSSCLRGSTYRRNAVRTRLVASDLFST